MEGVVMATASMELQLFLANGKATARLRDAAGVHGPVEIDADTARTLSQALVAIRNKARSDRYRVPPLPSRADDVDMRATSNWVPSAKVRAAIEAVERKRGGWWMAALDWFFGGRR